MTSRAGRALLDPSQGAKGTDFFHDRPAFVVAVVEMRRDPDPSVRPPVDDESMLDQLLARVLRPFEVDADRASPLLRLSGRIDAQPLLVGDLDQQLGLTQR